MSVTTQLERFSRRIPAPQPAGLCASCPRCGHDAAEFLRTVEGSGIFVWFKCADPACRGVALGKFPVA